MKMYIDRANADHLTAQLTKMGNTSSRLRKEGICTHGWMQHGKCLHCGRQFSSSEEGMEEGSRILRENM